MCAAVAYVLLMPLIVAYELIIFNMAQIRMFASLILKKVNGVTREEIDLGLTFYCKCYVVHLEKTWYFLVDETTRHLFLAFFYGQGIYLDPEEFLIALGQDFSDFLPV